MKQDSSSKKFRASISAYEGKIEVKGKTLGRWTEVDFIIDPEQRIFALKKSKKDKIFHLQDCQVKLTIQYFPFKVLNVEKKKKRTQFILSTKNKKNYHFGSDNEQFTQQIINLIIACSNNPNKEEKKSSIDIPKFFQTPQILDILAKKYDLNDYELVNEKDYYQLYAKKDNQLSFFLRINVPDVSINVVYNLLYTMEINKMWNEYLHENSKVIKFLEQDKSFLLSELRNYKEYFYFPREYVQMRHSFKTSDNEIYIIEKSIDNEEMCYQENKIPKGQNKFTVYQIISKNEFIRIEIFSEQNLNGLSIPSEESQVMQQYFQGLTKIVKHIKENKEELEQMYKEEIQDEFFDCEEDEDKFNERLMFSTTTVRLSQLVQVPQSDNEWVDMKMKQIATNQYLTIPFNVQHVMEPQEKHEQPILVKELEGGHYFLKQDFVREERYGGLKLINQIKIENQKSTIKFLLKRIGTALLTGKALTNISMPVYIFEARTTLDRLANSLGFAPQILDKAAQSNNLKERLILGTKFGISFLLNFFSIEKPFNPVIGETYQGLIDNCPVYAEQVSHHPPITCIQYFGRGYKIYLRLEQQALIHSNSLTGRNIGYVNVMFQNQKLTIILAPGLLSGTTIGDRVFTYQKKQFVIDEENKLMSEIIFNPDKKAYSYYDVKQPPQQDYLVGGTFTVKDQTIDKYRKDGFKSFGGLDFKQDVVERHNIITGSWTQSMYLDGNYFFSMMEEYPHQLINYPYPLASDSNYRLDLLWWKNKNFEKAQGAKETIEQQQRNDKKLRNQRK